MNDDESCALRLGSALAVVATESRFEPSPMILGGRRVSNWDLDVGSDGGGVDMRKKSGVG
jgi:hypothetical protein